MGRARQKPPATLLGAPVTAVDDLLPENDVLTFRTAATRVVIRPSGTEPKLKAYLEVVEPVTQGDVTAARARAADALATLREEIAAALGV
jgi:phosphomannomutase